ncbi:hypothetical protein GC722_17250 [Auraticoccus sp. F435]|uniref:Sensor domain-containing protein n=1 Tax=Auraticoccus cholistanensis TaxID=2656650 RepID=A0A6A9V286_9ACTN|nr:hypothetical protein [Auraticoccus cholistanensis]MVA77746.1 hypothetical protein [Auraticoccus cholistanensis]
MRVRTGTPAAVVLLLVLSGCSAGTQPGVPTPEPTVATTAPGTATPATAGGSPQATTTPAETPTASSPDREPPPRPTAPAPSTAGDLDQDDLPREVLGFTAEERPPSEGEYVPNGTWTHAVDPAQAAWEALPRCGATPAEEVVPEHALAATYLDEAGRPGNGLLMSFADADTAGRYARGYRELLQGCPNEGAAPLVVEPVAEDGSWYAGRRGCGPERWSELVLQREAEVLLLIVQDDGTADADELTELATDLTR